MVIVTTADDRFALPMGVTLYSALANLAGVKVVSLYILDGGISEEHKRKLTEVLSVKHVDVHLMWIRPDLVPLNGLKTSGRRVVTRSAGTLRQKSFFHRTRDASMARSVLLSALSQG